MKNKRTTRKKKRILSVLLAATVTFSVLLAGTYAWRSVSQKATNEVKGQENPGARLHDDFSGLNLSSTLKDSTDENKVKYVYVENFTDGGNNIYARIRLEEYLETGVGAGKATNDASKTAEPLVKGTTIENKKEWTPYKWNDDQTFRDYVSFSTGGDTVYMPTFNKDQDSLEADINGTLAGLDKDIETTADDYSDYVEYEANDTVNDIEIYDAEGDGLDKIKEAGLDIETIIAAVKDPATGRFNVSPTAGSIVIEGITCTIEAMEPVTLDASSDPEDITAIHLNLDPVTIGEKPMADITLRAAEHTAKKTLDTLEALDKTNTPGIISMETWKKPTADGGMNCQPGLYWVYDSEGWLYWAQPIEPGTATGCLLNGIAVNDATDKGNALDSTEYYYGLNVVAQFATADDWGSKDDKTGFYKDGLTPEGEDFLDIISIPDSPEKRYQVTIEPVDENATITQGSEVPFHVTVFDRKENKTVTEDATEVSWSVDPGSAGKEGRSVTVRETAFDENGNLKIAENETATSLTAIAVYNYDSKDPKKTVEGRYEIEVIGELSYGVTITPEKELTMVKGDTLTELQTMVTKTIGDHTDTAPAADGTVQWKVVDAATGNALNSKTVIDPKTGKLTVDPNEPAAKLKVTAIYTVDYVNEEGENEGQKSWTAEKVISLKDYSYETTITLTDVDGKGSSSAPTQESVLTFQADIAKKVDDQSTPKTLGSGETITWSVTDADGGKPTDAATKFDTTSGTTVKLTIGPSEAATALKVTATYQNTNDQRTQAGSRTVSPIGKTTYKMSAITANADAEPGKQVTYTATVTKTNGQNPAGTVIKSGIIWTLSGTPSDPATKLDQTTGVLTIGTNETNANLTVKATYQDPKNTAGSAGCEATKPVGTILTTNYTVTVSPASTTVTQGASTTLTATVKPADGTASANAAAIANPTVEWKVTNANDTGTKLGTATATSTGSSVSLTVGANETQTSLKITATYKIGTTAQPTAGNATVTVNAYTYQLSLNTTTVASLKQQGTQDFTATVKKMVNGTSVETKTVTAAELTWNVAATSGTKKSDTAMSKPSAAVGRLTVGKYETSPLNVTVSYKNASDGKSSNTATATVNAITAATYTMANISLSSGSAKPNTDMTFSTSVTRTDAKTETITNGITWSLVGTPTDSSTKVTGSNGTATLHIGSAETNSGLKVKATYTDSTASKTVTKEYSVGDIATTTYTIEVTRDGTYTADLVQGDIVTYSAKVKRTNGTQTGTYVTNPSVTWSTTGSATGVTSAKATSSDNTVVKQTLTIGASATGTAKLTAAYSGATTVTAYNKTIVAQTYAITVSGTNSGLVQQDTATYTATVKKSNGQGNGTTLSNPTVTWILANNDGGTTNTSTGNTTTVTFGASQSTKAVTLTASYGGSSSAAYSTGTIAKLAYTVTVSGGSSAIVQEETGSAYTAIVKKSNGQNAGKQLTTTLTSSNLTWSVATVGNSSTTMTGQTYGAGTGTAKLKIAETESATSLTVKATYKDTTNNLSYSSSGSTVSVTKSVYSISNFSVGTTTLDPGGSTAISITVKKTNGTAKTVATTASDSKLIWTVNGNKNSGTKVSGNNLTIASAETATSITLTPTYTAANGKTATTTAKTITIEQGTDEQKAVKNADVGDTVTIGTDEFYKVYDDGTKSLLWAVKTDTGFVGTAFGSNQQWTSSNARSYLSKTGTYVSNHSKIGEMIKAGIIPQVTIYTRTSPTNATLISTNDYIFLLSEADLDGQIYYYNSSSDNGYKTPDSKEYTAGVKLTGITTAMRKDSSVSYYSWLRSPRDNTSYVAGLNYNYGGVSSGLYTGTGRGVRPAFWVNH